MALSAQQVFDMNLDIEPVLRSACAAWLDADEQASLAAGVHQDYRRPEAKALRARADRLRAEYERARATAIDEWCKRKGVRL